jgi:hypothetical protein
MCWKGLCVTPRFLQFRRLELAAIHQRALFRASRYEDTARNSIYGVDEYLQTRYSRYQPL